MEKKKENSADPKSKLRFLNLSSFYTSKLNVFCLVLIHSKTFFTLRNFSV